MINVYKYISLIKIYIIAAFKIFIGFSQNADARIHSMSSKVNK